MNGYQNNWEYLSEELRRLDLALSIQVLRARQQNENKLDSATPVSMDEFRGLALSDREIDDLLYFGFDRSESDAASERANSSNSDNPEMEKLVDELRAFEREILERRNAALEQNIYLSLPYLSYLFCLTPFEEQTILLCLAPELNRKYERIFAYLQDDITQKKPSVDFVLSMLCGSAEEGTTKRRFFSADAMMMKCGLLKFVAGEQEASLPLISRHLKLDDRIVDSILELNVLDKKLLPFASLVQPQVTWDQVQAFEDLRSRMVTLTQHCIKRSAETNEKLVFLLQGDYGTGKREAAEALCKEMGICLVVADVVGMLGGNQPFEEALWLLFRESLLLPAAIYLSGFESIVKAEDNSRYLSALVRSIDAFSRLTFLDSEVAWEPMGEFRDHFFMTVDFPVPDYSVRKSCWDVALDGGKFPVSPDVDSGELANKFRISGGQIRDAYIKARNLSLWRDLERGQIQMDDLYDACRSKSNQNLNRLAQKINPKYTWDDIVLPPNRMEQLREICNQSRYRHVVYEDWGFERKLSFGKGLNALFSGPPGTGKTMAAEVIANELHLDLYKIDLSQVVSKYIGETEKNLHRIFSEAKGSNAILFFDEADALFGKRSEVKDAHDRYANIEIGYLLQKMEEYDGIAILATNLRKNMDEAFVRRMQFIVEFPFPDEEHRQRIWEVTFPLEVPICEDVDFGVLAREFRLSGGNIKNVALAGAFYAASDGKAVRMEYLICAVRREYQKLGRTWREIG